MIKFSNLESEFLNRFFIKLYKALQKTIIKNKPNASPNEKGIHPRIVRKKWERYG